MELKYDSNTIISGARNFIDAVTDATISHIARTTDGSILLNEVYKILKCVTLENQTKDRCMKITRGFAKKESAVVAPVKKPNDTAQPRKLSDAEITEYKGRAKRGERFKEEIVWELPEGGVGFTVYNRDDVKKDGLDQIGTKETIERIIRIGGEWYKLHSDRLLQIGDISRPGGLDTSD